VWVENTIDTFTFNYTTHPDLINVDADKVLLCEKTDNKTGENFVHQYKFAPNYLDRKEALDFFNKKGMAEMSLGLKDKYTGLRRLSIDRLAKSKYAKDDQVVIAVELIANTEKDKKTKASAIKFLASTNDAKYAPLYKKYINDSSYTVAGAALEGLSSLEPAKSYELAKKYSLDAKGALGEVVTAIFITNGTEADFDFIADQYKNTPPTQDKLEMTDAFCDYLVKVTDVLKVKKGIDYVIKFREFIPEQYRKMTDAAFKGGFDKLSKAKPGEVAEYIKVVFN